MPPTQQGSRRTGFTWTYKQLEELEDALVSEDVQGVA